MKAQTTSPLFPSIFQPSSQPKYEVRAVWLTTLNGLDWPHTRGAKAQQQELIDILDRLKEAGINTVLFQTRVRATTVYPSDIEPWDPVFNGGAHPGYDPLQFCIDECHKRGIECHAWVCTIPIGKWNRIGCLTFRKKNARMVKRIGDEGYMNPEDPQTAVYLANICREIVHRYDVDGIHLDYIRYPETWPQKVNRQKGREHITSIVRTISRAVKNEKPWVKMSCSPVGKYDNLTRYKSGGWNARTAVCQDAQAWLREGLMDQLYPMMYFAGNNFYPFAIDWQEQSNGRTVIPGLGIYFLDSKEGRWTLDVVAREMNVVRQIGMGHCYFRSMFFTNNVGGIYDFARQFDIIPALVPPMTWMNVGAPAAPASLMVDGQTLRWSAVSDANGGPHIYYNVYASYDYPVDVSCADNIMTLRLTTTSCLVPLNGMNYAVTAMNSYGVESDACQLQLSSASTHVVKRSQQPLMVSEGDQPPLIETDGRTLNIPESASLLDATFIMVENMAGHQIAVFPFNRQIDIKSLPDGIYQLRSLGRKGRHHRLGFFQIQRQAIF